MGTLVAVSSLSEVQHESYTEATVLLVKHIGGEEDIPEVRSASSQLLLHLTSAPLWACCSDIEHSCPLCI